MLQGNLMLKPTPDAIKMIRDMCSNPYNNYGDKRIMKRPVNQVESAGSHYEQGKQIQALSRQIETFIKTQSQALISSPPYPTCNKRGYVYALGDCIVSDELARPMEEVKFVGGRNNEYKQYSNKFNQGQNYKQNEN